MYYIELKDLFTHVQKNSLQIFSDYDDQKSRWRGKMNTQHVPLRQNTEEKGLGKVLEVVWNENEYNETVV